MRDIAVVAFAQRQESKINTESEVEFMVPLMNEAKDAVGLTQQEMGFTCSGSSDFLAGQAFSFVMTIDGTGPVPPISESHVEQDGAWALYEAWVKLQCGDIDTAFVYSYGKSSPGSLRDVLATQMDPYYVAPLWPDAFAIEAMAARHMLEQGVVSERQLAEIASRSRAHAASNPHAVRTAPKSVDEILAEARARGVDMTQWGPADFSFSRGTPRLQHSEAIRPYEALVIEKSLEYGIAPRIELHSVEQAKRYIDLGVKHFCIGWDRFILKQQLTQLGEGMRKLTEGL